MKIGKLKQFLHQPAGPVGQPRARLQRDGAPWPALGTINLIFATLESDANLRIGDVLTP